jgi:hypothetical protein
MIEIRSSASECDISGSRAELESVKHEITRSLLAEENLVIDANGEADPSPWERTLICLIVRKAAGPTKVAISDRGLVVDGSLENLNRFASFFDFDPAAEAGTHLHYDFIGNTFVSPNSIPLVIRVR